MDAPEKPVKTFSREANYHWLAMSALVIVLGTVATLSIRYAMDSADAYRAAVAPFSPPVVTKAQPAPLPPPEKPKPKPQFSKPIPLPSITIPEVPPEGTAALANLEAVQWLARVHPELKDVRVDPEETHMLGHYSADPFGFNVVWYVGGTCVIEDRDVGTTKPSTFRLFLDCTSRDMTVQIAMIDGQRTFYHPSKTRYHDELFRALASDYKPAKQLIGPADSARKVMEQERREEFHKQSIISTAEEMVSRFVMFPDTFKFTTPHAKRITSETHDLVKLGFKDIWYINGMCQFKNKNDKTRHVGFSILLHEKDGKVIADEIKIDGEYVHIGIESIKAEAERQRDERGF